MRGDEFILVSYLKGVQRLHQSFGRQEIANVVVDHFGSLSQGGYQFFGFCG